MQKGLLRHVVRINVTVIIEESEQERGVPNCNREMKAHTCPLATHPVFHLHIIAMQGSYYTTVIYIPLKHDSH